MKLKLLAFLLMPSLAFGSGWECINRTLGACNTWRMTVPKGWIVTSDNSAGGGEHSYAMTFVPDEQHEWKI
jgi:hypothetical protein